MVRNYTQTNDINGIILTDQYNQGHQSTRACDNKVPDHHQVHHQREDIAPLLTPQYEIAVCVHVSAMPDIRIARTGRTILGTAGLVKHRQ